MIWRMSRPESELEILDVCDPAQASLDVVEMWGGAVNTVSIDEAEPDIACIGGGRRFVIQDVSDPANPL